MSLKEERLLNQNLDPIKVSLSSRQILEDPINSIKTIYSDKSDEVLNNIKHQDIQNKIKNEKRLYVHDLCELARSQGRFEKITLGLLLVMALTLGFYGNIGELTFRPVKFECHEWVEGSYQYVPCTETEACTQYKTRYRIKDSKFLSVTKKFGLYCEKKDLLDVMMNIIILFSPLSCFIIGYIADFIGRRHTMFLLLGIGTLGFLLSFFGEEFTLFIIGNCLLRSFLHSSVMVIYLYSNEMLGNPLRSQAISLVGLSLALGQMLFLCVYEAMTSYKQVYLVQAVALLVCAPVIRFLRESPFHLAHNKKFHKLSKVLKKIMETNFKGNVVSLTSWLKRKGSRKSKWP